MLKILNTLNDSHRQYLVDRLKSADRQKYISVLGAQTLRKIDSYLSQHNFPPIEYFLLFSFPANNTQLLHIDGDQTYRKCSLNFLIEGKAKLEYFKTDSPPNIRTSSTGIKSYECNIETASLVSSTQITSEMLITTDVPHRVVTEEPTILLCARFVNNPSFQQVLDAVKSS
jgi:hypothetical protein